MPVLGGGEQLLIVTGLFKAEVTPRHGHVPGDMRELGDRAGYVVIGRKGGHPG